MIDFVDLEKAMMPMSQPEENNCFALEMFEGRLQLRKRDEPRWDAIYVDFIAGANEYRRKYGGGRKQAIARAVGLKKGISPVVVDATAGLGRDAFVLASLGCRVHMIERSPQIAKLLEDGLNRAKRDPHIGVWVSQLMSLAAEDSQKALLELSFKPDVVYLDPMYPQKRKPALVKKEMRIFQSLLGHDLDVDDLFKIALKVAKKRIVVKRPAISDWLAGRAPNTSIKTRKNRFDIYLTKNGKSIPVDS